MKTFTQTRPEGLRALRFEEVPEEVKAAERMRLELDLSRERQWIETVGWEIFANKASVLTSIKNNVLIPVSPNISYRQYFQDRTNLDVIQRLDEEKFSVPFLRPQALAVLGHVTTTAHTNFVSSKAGERFLHDNDLDTIQFAVISMTRTLLYQRCLTAADKLAFDGVSAHTLGLAFDIDHSGFYVTQNGKTLPVNVHSNPWWYSDEPIHALHEVLEEKSAEGMLNFVTELPEGRGCYHITVNPFIDLMP